MEHTQGYIVTTFSVHVRHDLSWQELIFAAVPQTIDFVAELLEEDLRKLPKETQPSEQDVALVAFDGHVSTDSVLHWGSATDGTPPAFELFFLLSLSTLFFLIWRASIP